MAVLAMFVIMAGSALQGVVGFGANVIAVPILLQVDPVFVPGPLLLISLVQLTLITRREQATTDRSELLWTLGPRIPGAVLGAVILATVSVRELSIILATITFAFVVLSLSKLRIPVSRPTLAIAGFLGGIGGTSVGIGGPPVAIVLQHRTGPDVRGFMSRYAMIGGWMSLIGIIAAGRLGTDEVIAALILLPGSLLGFLISGPARTYLDRGYTRPLVLVMATLSSLTALLRFTL